MLTRKRIYEELIRKNVIDESCDASLWPSYVSEFAQSLQNEMGISSWSSAVSLLSRTSRVSADHTTVNKVLANCPNDNRTNCMSDDTSTDLWDNSDDGGMDERLCTVFHTALSDCARIRAVVKAERLTDALYPKESFLVILVRNAMLNAHERLATFEEVPVVLPRHPSGEEIPLLSYVEHSLYAPLVVSVDQEMPVAESLLDFGRRLSNEDSSGDVRPISREPLSMPEAVKLCGRPPTSEVEEEEEEGQLSPRFEAYFLAYSSSAKPPAVCNIPVLCMADAEQLPVLLTSLLYQQRVWRIRDPLVGVQFSKYDTTIRLFVGWLDDDHRSSSRFPLPRVHVGEIRTPFMLDLSSPSMVLIACRLLCSLESHIRDVRDTASHLVGAVIRDTQSNPSLSWRIDTDDTQEESTVPIPGNNDTREMIVRWLKTQGCSADEDHTTHTRQRDKFATSSSTPHGSTSRRSLRLPPSSQAFEAKGSSVATSQNSDAKPKVQKSHACSEFAATGENDYPVFRWMFDRGVVPQPIVNDVAFRDEYSAMTALVWPETWNSSEDLPSVDLALKPCVEELLQSIDTLKREPGAVKCIPVENFPVDLQIFTHSFSAIFQASHRSREKTRLSETVCESAWRHDHDHLLFDFFIRLVRPKKGHTIQSLIDRYSITHLEDPLSRPTLETTLRLPKYEDMQSIGRDELIDDILSRKTPNSDWLRRRGGPDKVIEFTSKTETQRIPILSRAPTSGKCDALGRLLVELPKVPARALRRFQLVTRTESKGEKDTERPKAEDRSVQKKSGPVALKLGMQKVPVAPISDGSSLSLTEQEMTDSETTDMKAAPYTLPSSSAPVVATKTHMSKHVDHLADRVEQLQLYEAETTVAQLELPILVVRYRKADEKLIQGTNQLSMYLTAAVKFLGTIGITNFAVYGVQTDGPIVLFPAAILRNDDFVYLYERLTEKVDISTPVGAWHYATILCRLAQNHAKILEEKFEQVKGSLVASLLAGSAGQMGNWTMEHQRMEWVQAGLTEPESEATEKPKARLELE